MAKHFVFPDPVVDHLLVVDVEATCCNNKTITKDDVEIIEIGAVLLHWPTLQSISTFQSYVQPVKKPKLTSFCTRLTGITQGQVDAAPRFPDVLQQMKVAILQEHNIQFCSWSPFDWKQLKRDCVHHQIAVPKVFGHWDLQVLFRRQQKHSHNMSLVNALRSIDLQFEGKRHSGIDDAINTARLASYCFPDICQK